MDKIRQLEFEILREKFNGLFPHKYEVFTEVCIITPINKNPLQRAIITKCNPHYIKDDAISYEVELISTKEKIKVAENDLIIPSNIEERTTVETNVEPTKITAISVEKNINDNIIDTGTEKVQVIEDKLEDLNKSLDKKLDKVSKLTKLLFISHFI